MSKLICYPAVIYNSQGFYQLHFIDLCFGVAAKTFKEAIELAKEELGQHYLRLIEEKQEIPRPSEIVALDPHDKVIYIECNPDLIKRANIYKSVNRTVTLPKWLNNKATESGINVSMVLQKALIEILNAEEPSK